jgi:hypothetical protein
MDRSVPLLVRGGGNLSADPRWCEHSRAEELLMDRDVPYAAYFIFAAVFVAIGLMVWSMAGTSGGRVNDHLAQTKQSQQLRTTESPIPAPTAPNNDVAADSTRTSPGPQNRSR